MFDLTYELVPDVDAYLARIGYTGSRELTRETLNQLVYAHQSTVPFESLDCSVFKKPITLDVAHLFEKVVTNRRGGFCFELNGLFTCLLRTMGFDAFSVMCKIVSGKSEMPPVRHRGVVVRLDGKRYFCDVGFGGGMAPFAVELNEEKQTVFGETYWITPGPEGWLRLHRISGRGYGDEGKIVGQEQEVIYFAPIAFQAADFHTMSVDCATRPDSVFVVNRNASKRIPGGFTKINELQHITVVDGVKTVRDLTEEEFLPAMKEVFGIEACEYTV